MATTLRKLLVSGLHFFVHFLSPNYYILVQWIWMLQISPGGLLYFHEWNNLQYVSSAAFLLTVYSDYLSAAKAKIACPDAQVQPRDLLSFAKSQVHITNLVLSFFTTFFLNISFFKIDMASK